MDSLKAMITGIAPLVLHSENLCNPLHPITRDLKKLTKLRNKTDDIINQIKWLEWRGGMYAHDGRPVIPADNILANTVHGARRFKKGKQVEGGVIAAQPHFFLQYKGPRTVDKLEGNDDFCDYRSVVVNRARVMRARPLFREWSAEIEWLFDPEIIEEDDLRQAILMGGERVGLMERRPRCGRFIAEFK